MEGIIHHIFLTSYSYFYFSFPHLNELADFITNEEFMVPEEHIDAINQAFSKHHPHVFFFISVQNSKLIHVCFCGFHHHRDCVKWKKEPAEITRWVIPLRLDGGR